MIFLVNPGHLDDLSKEYGNNGVSMGIPYCETPFRADLGTIYSVLSSSFQAGDTAQAG